jgi:methylisocitrate lyase
LRKETPSFREIVASGRPIEAVGCGDPLGARIIEQAGFETVYLSGYYASACIGYFDVGVVSMYEMAEQVHRVSRSISVPLLVDADEGYGAALHAARTTREFEAAGAGALIIEDQPFPKVCSALPIPETVTAEEMCGKIQAVAEARRKDTYIIARTACFDVEGVEGMIRRGRLYRKAGADALQLRGSLGEEDLKRYRDAVDGPLVMADAWLDAPASRFEELGIQIVLRSVTLLRLSMRAMRDGVQALRESGRLGEAVPMLPSSEMHALLGMHEVLALEDRYHPRNFSGMEKST